jgi:hypothetical protein
LSTGLPSLGQSSSQSNVVSSSSTGSQSKIGQGGTPLQQGVKYTGKICNNEIEMYLNFDGNQINGSYFYKSQNKPIQLKGKFDGGMGRDALGGFLFEESVNGEKTGEFNTLSPEGVILVSDYPNRVNQIKGTWINAKTGAKLPFEVRRVVVIAQSSSSQGQTGENFEDILKYIANPY